jgi:hypothetical protein
LEDRHLKANTIFDIISTSEKMLPNCNETVIPRRK